MFSRLLFRLVLFVTRNLKFVTRHPKIILVAALALFIAPFVGLIAAKIYQSWDDDPDRGAIAIKGGAFGESYSIPEYLNQGWSEADSLWFYNTTQGSGLLPYDFFLVLEQAESKERFLSPKNIDRFRYLPQKRTFFNPDALPVGFAKEPYQGKDYVGFTCAACHTGQVNYEGRALRIDGGPAMADMVGFMRALQKSMEATQKGAKWERFAGKVLELDNDYDTKKEVEKDLKKWTKAIRLYNTINHSTYTRPKTNNPRRVKYGYARLDAFGRIYNRVIQHTINRDQVGRELALVTKRGKPLLNEGQIAEVLEGLEKIILVDDEFSKIFDRLGSTERGYPGLSRTDLFRVRNQIFNPPNAPVSYPFLWDIAHSDYVQWNGLASNAGPGPLGRNAGEVIGVFGILDWQEDNRWLTRLTGFSLSALVSGQATKKKQIYFKSSIDLFNLERLESHLRTLKSPRWPFCKNKEGAYYLPAAPKDDPVDERPCAGGDTKVDSEKAKFGQLIYASRCQSCHEVIDREAWDRLVVSKMLKIGKAGTDRAMAKNSVNYKGKSGNLKHTYQTVKVGKVIVEEDAPVVQILTAATTGVVGTPDADKWLPRRIVEYVYALVMTVARNQIKASVKSGNYDPDTTANPYNSLLSYRARSLNGIWATAPYLHNGSVPSLYDLLLPAKRESDMDGGRCEKYRPHSFIVGAREFDPVKVGFRSEGYDGFKFKTDIRGNRNRGHEYGACKMTDPERWQLIEYLKTL